MNSVNVFILFVVCVIIKDCFQMPVSRRRGGKRTRRATWFSPAASKYLYPPSEYGIRYVPRSEATVARYGAKSSTATFAQKQARKEDRYVGRGKYGLLKKVGMAALRGGARAFMGAGTYTGMGEYSSNDLVAGASSSVADVRTAEDETGAVTIANREYIGDIYGLTTSQRGFANYSYDLNPGLESSFPWLAQIAANYDEYQFIQLMFTYRTVTSDISSTNGQVGSVIMATNYNASAEPFSDKSAMMTYAHSSSAKTSDDLIHGIECDPSKLSGDTGKYVRSSPVQVGDDPKTYDWGKFQIAVANTPSVMASQTIGELWVTYRVVLRKPKVSTGKGNSISRFCMVTPVASTGNEYQPFANSALNVGYMQQNSLALDFRTTGTSTPSIGLPLNTAAGPYHLGDAARTVFNPTLGGFCNVLVIPGSYSGVLRLAMYMEGTFDAVSGHRVMLGLPCFLGNVEQYSDLFGAGGYLNNAAQVGDTPGWSIQTPLVAYQAGVAQTWSAHMVCHVRVYPATGGVDNAIVWFNDNVPGTSTQGVRMVSTSGTNLVVSQAYLDVTEYNSSAAQSATVAAPVFVNGVGAIVPVY